MPDTMLVDASGATEDVGLAGVAATNVAPTGDGRIYMSLSTTPAQEIQYLDASNALHTLLDSTGTVPYEFMPGFGNLQKGMIYDPGTGSLFIASLAPFFSCSGTNSAVNFWRVPLSADGTRQEGPVTCGEFDVDPLSGDEDPEGWSHGPNGELLLVVDTNSNAAQPRLVLVDPVTVTGSAYDTVGFPFAAATNAGCCSSLLGKGVVFDTSADVLRAYGPGEGGAGTVITGQLGNTPGGTAQTAMLFEIAPLPYASGLAADATSISLAAGGTQTLSLDAGSGFAGDLYLVAGSASGWCPGLPVDLVTVPLVFDAYTLFTLTSPSTPPLASSFAAVADLELVAGGVLEEDRVVARRVLGAGARAAHVAPARRADRRGELVDPRAALGPRSAGGRAPR